MRIVNKSKMLTKKPGDHRRAFIFFHNNYAVAGFLKNPARKITRPSPICK